MINDQNIEELSFYNKTLKPIISNTKKVISREFLESTMEEEYGYCSVVVSEGAEWPDGRFLAEQGTRDVFGHAQLGGAAPVIANMIKEVLGYKYHWAVADYLQRSARHIASKTDVEQAYALGKAAVELSLGGENAIMPTIIRKSDDPYEWEVGKVSLSEVANIEKFTDVSFCLFDCVC